MRVVMHHSKNYNWVPVPEGVTVTAPDVDSGKVKRNISGGWSMRVTEERDNFTTVVVPEELIAKMIIFEKCRPRPSTCPRQSRRPRVRSARPLTWGSVRSSSSGREPCSKSKVPHGPQVSTLAKIILPSIVAVA